MHRHPGKTPTAQAVPLGLVAEALNSVVTEFSAGPVRIRGLAVTLWSPGRAGPPMSVRISVGRLPSGRTGPTLHVTPVRAPDGLRIVREGPVLRCRWSHVPGALAYRVLLLRGDGTPAKRQPHVIVHGRHAVLRLGWWSRRRHRVVAVCAVNGVTGPTATHAVPSSRQARRRERQAA